MRVISLAIGFILDLIIGDPYSLPHPICLVGNGIKWGEKKIRNFTNGDNQREFIGGMILSITIVLLSFAVPFLILWILGQINFYLALAVNSIFCYQILATKCLKDESLKVYNALKNGTIEDGRAAVSMIVGRDTENLSEEGVIKATVETVAENTADGVVAPMIYFAIGGGPLAFMYKAINTLDSMIGYKNDKYLYFGRFAAKLDDVANYIPARISGILIVCAAKFLPYNSKNAWKIFKRDRYNHASPNSGQTESACAGALEIQLAGNANYFGKVYKKKTIGDPIKEINLENIRESIKLLYGAAIICQCVCLTLLSVICFM
ncbi:MAG: adenosylcobinamide-phosphate synthase CbiB [Anaerovoracaceae bacterium]